jgi:uracil-DNA glycosylase
VNQLVEPLSVLLDRAPASWSSIVRTWRDSPAGRRLEAFVAQRQSEGAAIYPATVLRALELTPRERVRVVILGQDPYHGPGQAEGLAFSVPGGQRLPPSLRNIFAELQRDLGMPWPAAGHLGGWARQGVLLLNTSLTVEDGQPGAHARHGWEALTDEIVEAISKDPGPKAFMLWGAHAQAKAALISGGVEQHAVLMANHPSPLSARRGPTPFLGCGHFGAANRFLVGAGAAPIDWSLGGFQ